MTVRSMTDDEYRRIVGDAKAFLEAVIFVENRIQELKARSDVLSPIEGDKGWRSHDVWRSLKTVSHFNLQNAFELGLKSLLGSIGIPFFQVHSLKEIYDLIPQETAKRLNDVFHEEAKNHPIVLKAFVSTKESSPPPERPKSRPLSTLREFCEYFDEDVKLWKKRYSWEEVTTGEWMHYVDNLEAFIAFLNRLEQLNIEDWNNRRG